jgi:hypothetical protein
MTEHYLLLIHRMDFTYATLLYCIRQKWMFIVSLHLEKCKFELCGSNNNFHNRGNVDMVNRIICCWERCIRN